ncbi:MAG: acyltransferase [Accumulibacter sp.]|jgi:acetyltransferase-like isoleucine patch superfamily enzyme
MKILNFGSYPHYLRLLRWRIYSLVIARREGLSLGAKVRFLGLPIISLAEKSQIKIGSRAVICSDSRYTELGVNHPVVIRTLRPGAEIVIGNDSGLSGTTLCAAQSISIGRDCLVGANVTIADTDFHSLNPIGRRYNKDYASICVAPVVVGDNVFIGANSVVLKGASIGDNSIIGAGSVVTSEIPPNSIAAGNPARIIAKL